ncbi:MAG: RidA family protein [Opitutaceae bacterium]
MAAFVISASPVLASEDIVRRTGEREQPGFAWSATVSDVPLVMTGQVFGWLEDGSVRDQSVSEQADRALENLDAVLASSGSGLSRVVKLNVYLRRDEDHDAVAAAIGRAFSEHPVPVSWVRTALLDPSAQVAFDAVAQAPAGEGAVRAADVNGVPALEVGAHVGILPAGRKVFLSGRALRGESFRGSVRAVLEDQNRTIRHHGLDPSNVVRVKAWVNPLHRIDDLNAELVGFFGDHPVPPTIVIGWTSVNDSEIEFVLGGANADDSRFSGPVSFGTRPGQEAPTRFSHVAFVEAGQPLIFISGLFGDRGELVREQTQDMFARLGRILFDTGSGFGYLVKGTYYNIDREGRAALGDIRHVFFDPERPPAASGVVVHGVGREGHAATLDMIAVPLPEQ